MDRNKRNKKYHSNWRNQNQSSTESLKQKVSRPQFNPHNYIDDKAEQERKKAISELKAEKVICAKCGKPVTELASCITDKETNSPVHFECVIKDLGEKESLGENEKIAYIGQGRFGVLYFENPRDQRKFTIKKIIEVEDRENRAEWRDKMSGLYSQVQ